MDIEKYWNAVLGQDASAMRKFFREDACICWHNTNEQFTTEEFIRANCEYPGEWEGELRRLEQNGEQMVTVVQVRAKDESASFHVVSFLRIQEDKICSLDEYWGEDGEAPEWRQDVSANTGSEPEF